MTAGRQPTGLRRTGRIIERPRLIKQLGESDASVILLVGPAGYGKTVLARQWTRVLSRVVWVSCTPAHRDVVTFAEDIAAGIDALGGDASRFISEYIRARSNPQRAAREIAIVLSDCINEASTQWLVIDDYQEIAESAATQDLVFTLRDRVTSRLLIASRTRPSWVSTRDVVYGDATEVGARDLALTPAETVLVIGSRPDLAPVIEQAQGWPAVLTLAAGLSPGSHRTEVVPAMVHQYVADELFRSAAPDLQERLTKLALMPDLTRPKLTQRFGDLAVQTLADARSLGFVGDGEPPALHPLLREFLLAKVAEDSSAQHLVAESIRDALDVESWDFALDLVLHFKLRELVDPVLHRAFRPLVSQGRLGTLARFAERVREEPGFPPPTVALIESEVALRDGRFKLAVELASQGRAQLNASDSLRSHASLLIGRASFLDSSFAAAGEAFEAAASDATEDVDRIEAAFGLATVNTFGELGDPSPWIAMLVAHRSDSPELLVRHASAELSRRRFAMGLCDPLGIDETLHHVSSVRDPKVRTAYYYTSAYALAQRAEYRSAERLVEQCGNDIQTFGLEFAQPFVDWTAAFVKIGLRQFGDADRLIQAVEDAAASRQHDGHALNARLIRARLLIQTGAASTALELLQPSHVAPVFPSWIGELHGLRAMALALLDSEAEALFEADRATHATSCLEVRILAQCARALALAEREPSIASDLVDSAHDVEIWDPVVCALRASPVLLNLIANESTVRPKLLEILRRSGDHALARQAGIRTRSLQSPAALLSPREQEVLGLVSQGFRNREIAAALFVAESTVKIHVRHILEKLGVRTRAEAVARAERTRLDT